MRNVTLAALGAAFSVVILAHAPALAADPSYMGTWKLSAAVMAPWADPAQEGGSREPSGLLGKTVAFRAKEIAGPRPFACKGPRYKIEDFTADMLFQGAFEEMQSRNKTADPKKIAASLGFSGEKTKTLETGCEIDFHFIDDTTAKAGLNNYVYTLTKQ